MANESKNNALLALLQNLYNKIAMISAQLRMNSYHKTAHSNMSFDITNVLNRQIDDLATRVVKVKNHPAETLDNELQQDITQNSREEKRIEGEEIEKVSSIESEFTKHLKQRKTSSISQPYIAEKLTASTWEHINSAILHARQGDVENAKLHTEIAGQALEEAGHFLSDKEYSELVFQIEHYFIDSQKVYEKNK